MEMLKEYWAGNGTDLRKFLLMGSLTIIPVNGFE